MCLPGHGKSQVLPQFLPILNNPDYFYRMKNILLLAFALCLSFGAMATKKNKKKKAIIKTTIAPAVTKTIDKANTMRLCMTPDPQPSWFLEVPKDFKFPANFQQPAAYRLVSTNDTLFHSFLKSIPYDKSKVKVVLPVFINNMIECKEFNISRTYTMDSVLQAKYPDLMSFSAFTSDNSLNAARIDCDGSSVKMMITYDKKVYYVTSTILNKFTYYMCYAKDDVNFVKDKFER